MHQLGCVEPVHVSLRFLSRGWCCRGTAPAAQKSVHVILSRHLCATKDVMLKTITMCVCVSCLFCVRLAGTDQTSQETAEDATTDPAFGGDD